jgi:SAM-dependent methyltransferase
MRPIDVPTRETVAFLEKHLSRKAQIIEVGCGEGNVAFELLKRGHQVTALDSDSEEVAKAQRRGVRAMVASWPDFDADPVDAIVFGRSLHHINPLPAAIDRAADLLKPDSLLLIEDFAVEEINRQTLDWFGSTIRAERGKRLIELPPDHFVTELLTANDPIKVWDRHHEAHGVHPLKMMRSAIGNRFTIRDITPVPYLYRYLVPILGGNSETTTLVHQVLAEETRLGAEREIVLVGRRIVGSKK